MNSNVKSLEDAFPTIVHYTGLVLSVVLVIACLLGYYVQAAPGFAVAGGMLLYRSVHNAAQSVPQGDDKPNEEEGQG